MSQPSSSPLDNTLLLFADISGYTRFIKQNPYSAAHALNSIRMLLDAVLDQLEPEFTLAKLEGDAAFLYASADALTEPGALPHKLQLALAAFDAGKNHMIASNVCNCNACLSLGRLDLKFILHQGAVLHFTVRNQRELGGLPVILLHRLSKNGVAAHRYILWTLALAARMQTLRPVSRLSEHYDEIGNTEVEVHELAAADRTPLQASRFDKFRDLLRKELPWWWLALRGVKGKAAAFDESPEQH